MLADYVRFTSVIYLLTYLCVDKPLSVEEGDPSPARRWPCREPVVADTRTITVYRRYANLPAVADLVLFE